MKWQLSQRLIFFLSILGFIFITLSLIIVALTPYAQSFEFSIYNAYPSQFWFLIAGSIFLGILIVIFAATDESIKIYWTLGWSIIITANIVLLCLPYARGYVIYGSEDVLSHIGWIKDILNGVNLGTSNPYPFDHILGSALSYISGLNVISVTFIIPTFFSILFILSYYSLAKRILPEGSILFAIAFSSILLFGSFHTLFMPNHQAFLMFPILLFLYFEVCNSNQSANFSLVLIIMLVALVFYHPLNTMLFVAVLGVIFFSNYFIKNRLNGETLKIKPPINLVAIIFVTFFSWSAYVSLLSESIDVVIQAITNEFFGTTYSSYTNIISTASPSILDIIILIYSTYGQWILMSIFALIAINIMDSIFLLNNNQIIIKRFSTNVFLIFSIITCVFLMVYIVGIGRVFTIAIIFIIFIISLFIYNYESQARSRRKKVMITSTVSLILLILLITSITNLFSSPITKEMNDQVTLTEINGANYYFSKRNSSIDNLEFGISVYRFYSLEYGSSTARENISYGDRLPKEHFGWPDYASLADYYDEQKYMIILPQGEFFYQNIYPEYESKWKFTSNDFSRLQVDPGVIRVYSNSGLDIFYVRR